MTSPPFVPNLARNAGFYEQVVAPLLAGWPHAAALLGWGSDVLGYDTPRSTDHGYGPRLQVFVVQPDVNDAAAALDRGLPTTYQGMPVRYGWDAVTPRHHVAVTTLGGWLTGHLGVDPRAGMSTLDWLSTPQQLLLGVVRGAVYADPDGDLSGLRRELAWYPQDVWLWLLASQWRRISQEHAFVGRAAEVGDDLGSRLVGSRLVAELMCLAFLQERQYRPYTKWFGTAFAQLPPAPGLADALACVLAATDHPSREDALVDAYGIVARRHNALGLTREVVTAVGPYHGRPFRVLQGDFASACRDAITDPWLRDLPLVGAVDQFVDSTDVLSDPHRSQALQAFHRSLTGPGA